MRVSVFLLATAALLATASAAEAGMPSPLPADVQRILRLGDNPTLRLQTISFFLLVLVGSTLGIRWLWNWVARGIPRLPRLSVGRSFGLVFLWCLVFVVVLTMISGARELMTPGAWEKQGFTYRIAPDSATEPADPELVRRQHMKELKAALWEFAATHSGRFPNLDETNAIAASLWEVPDAGGLRYQYLPGQVAGHGREILLYEPEWVDGGRLAIRVNGDIVRLTADEFAAVRLQGKRP